MNGCEWNVRQNNHVCSPIVQEESAMLRHFLFVRSVYAEIRQSARSRVSDTSLICGEETSDACWRSTGSTSIERSSWKNKNETSSRLAKDSQPRLWAPLHCTSTGEPMGTTEAVRRSRLACGSRDQPVRFAYLAILAGRRVEKRLLFYADQKHFLRQSFAAWKWCFWFGQNTLYFSLWFRCRWLLTGVKRAVLFPPLILFWRRASVVENCLWAGDAGIKQKYVLFYI